MRDSPNLSRGSHLKVFLVGMKAFQEIGRFIKPTTRMIQIFGNRAKRAKWDILEEDLKKLIAGERVPVNLGIDNGYVILSFRNRILGLGLFIDGAVISQIPKKDTRHLVY